MSDTPNPKYIELVVADGSFVVSTRVWDKMQQSFLPQILDGTSAIFTTGLAELISTRKVRLHITHDVAALVVDALHRLEYVTLTRRLPRVLALASPPVVPVHLRESFAQLIQTLGIVQYLIHEPCRGCSRKHATSALSMLCPANVG